MKFLYHNILTIIAAAMIITLSGCAVPMATQQADQEAKQFQVRPGQSNIYVYRDEFYGAAVPFNVKFDGKKVGLLGAKTYFLFETTPGRHEISSEEENTSTVVLNTQPGKNYFIWQEVKLGIMFPRVALHEVNEGAGRFAVSQCRRAQPVE